MTGYPKFLVSLVDLDDPGEAGSKAYNLGRTARLGIKTPGGAVIPDAVFQEHLARAGVLDDIGQLLAGPNDWDEQRMERSSAEIRGRIAATPLAAGLVDALRRQWSRSDRHLVVRSSAFGEDTARTSFAGQLDSFLNIGTFDALETAVKATWCSLFSTRVLLYCRHNRVTSRRMGVIVQPQVAARWSGVLFTHEPTAPSLDSLLLEYVPGLGEKLVSGEVTPGRLRINRTDLTITEEYVAADTGTLDAQARAALNELTILALQLEDEFGGAQDIEWCIDQAARPIVVQARPAKVNGKHGPEQHWSNANIAENFPEPVSPFLFSIVRPGYSAYFRNLGRGFGLSGKRLDVMQDAFENIVGLQGGRLYYNLSNIHALLQLMPAGERLVEFFNLFVGAESIPPPKGLPLNRLARAIEAIRIAVATCWKFLTIRPRIRRFERRADGFAARTHPTLLPEKSAHALATDLSAFLKIRFEQWNDAALADTAAMACYGALKDSLVRWIDVADQSALHNDLLKGLPGLASAMPVEKLWQLSRSIVADASLRELFTNNTAERILEQLRKPEFEGFSAAFDEYLDRWGFRSSAELMLTMPTPVEDPRALLELLRAYVRSDVPSPEARSEMQAAARIATTAAIAAEITPASWWRWVPLISAASRFRILLASTQGAIRLRERARMKQALLYTRLRHIALAIGDRLVDRGVLKDRDDIFLLSTGEVLALAADPRASAGTLQDEIESRRERLRHFCTVQPPDRLVLRAGETWDGKVTAPTAFRECDRSHSLSGNGACGGTASGDAAVVLDVSGAGRVKAGQILVTRQTDPGWAAVFFLVRGLVIERGGMLSHGAIIAREYGIPAVVGVSDATRLIRDGDLLHVDGDHGLVQFNHR